MCDVKERKALSTPQGPYYIRNIVLFFRIGWLFVNGMIISGSVKTKCWRLKCPNMFKYLPRIRNTQQINYFINCASPASKTCYISCALSHLTHCLVSWCQQNFAVIFTILGAVFSEVVAELLQNIWQTILVGCQIWNNAYMKNYIIYRK